MPCSAQSVTTAGVISARGINEFHFNQNVAQLLRAQIEKSGRAQAFIINEDGADIELVERTEIARAQDADLFVSVHHDSVQPHYLSKWMVDGEARFYSDHLRGYSLFYARNGVTPQASLALAQQIGTQLRAAGFEPTLHHSEKIQGENRQLVDAELGIYNFDQLVMLKTAEIPAVLLECGIIVNREEEQLLSDPVYQNKLVTAVATAIGASCEQRSRLELESN